MPTTSLETLFWHLLDWDAQATIWLNQEWVHAWLDFWQPLLTASHHWRLPILLLLLGLGFKGSSELRRSLLLAAIAVGLCDLLSSKLVKPWIQAPRPCVWSPPSRLLIGMKRSYSFPSSHAANLVAAWTVLQGRRAPAWLVLPLGFACLWISYTRIYVGVHFLSDVFAGGLLGFLVGFLVLRARPVPSKGVK